MRRHRRLLAVLSSIAVGFLVAEVAFRAYLEHARRAALERVEARRSVTEVDTCALGDLIRLSNEQDLFYELKPHLSGRYCGGRIATNALGMRMAAEPALGKPPGMMRIVALGDSYLFGQGVDDGQGFLEVLQAEATARGRPIEMLNFGVPGYNAWMEAVVLSTRARHYAPDAIVVAVTGNDWDLPSFMLTRPNGDIGHSFVLGALAERLRGPPALVETPRSRVHQDHLLSVPEEVPEALRHMVGFGAYRRALRTMLDVAKTLRARLIFFSDCVSPDGPGGTSCTFPFGPGEYELVRQEIYSHPDVAVCPWQLPRELLILRDGHPSVDGHRSLARQLGSCLARQAILPP